MCQSCSECMYDEVKKENRAANLCASELSGLLCFPENVKRIKPDYLRNEADYYRRKKIKKDLNDAANYIEVLEKYILGI